MICKSNCPNQGYGQARQMSAAQIEKYLQTNAHQITGGNP